MNSFFLYVLTHQNPTTIFSRYIHRLSGNKNILIIFECIDCTINFTITSLLAPKSLQVEPFMSFLNISFNRKSKVFCGDWSIITGSPRYFSSSFIDCILNWTLMWLQTWAERLLKKIIKDSLYTLRISYVSFTFVSVVVLKIILASAKSKWDTVGAVWVILRLCILSSFWACLNEEEKAFAHRINK